MYSTQCVVAVLLAGVVLTSTPLAQVVNSGGFDFTSYAGEEG